MRTVTLKGLEVGLEPPASVAMRAEVWLASASNQLRAGCAALAFCWRGKHRPKVLLKAHGYDVLAFGGAVFDWLVEQGVPQGEILTAAGTALGVIYETIPSEEDVKEHVGFTDEAETPPPSID